MGAFLNADDLPTKIYKLISQNEPENRSSGVESSIARSVG